MRIRNRAGFTLLELLTVIAVIAVLAGLIFPTVRSAQVAARKAATRVRFGQWAAAIEAFRSEYGYYPVFDPGHLVNGGATPDNTGDHVFHDVLAGRRRSGEALVATSAAAAQNRKALGFYAFPDSDFTAASSPAPHLLCDAFGNPAIAVLVDRDLDGVIRAGNDFAALPAVDGLVPGAADWPAAGIRAGVVFYVAAPGASAANPAFICSWK